MSRWSAPEPCANGSQVDIRAGHRLACKLRLLSAVGLSGFGVMMTALTQVMRIGDPVVLFFTSVTLYLSEAVLFWMFFTGLWSVISRVTRRRLILPGVSESFLRRFAFFQIAFVAVWSILFKGVIYTTLRFSASHYLLAKGQSLGIAIPAECIILLLILVGVVKWWLRAVGPGAARRKVRDEVRVR